MIKEAYCSYEISKLLKEKGFDEPCLQVYTSDGKRYNMHSTCYQNVCDDDECLAPTLQMACAWLREKHLIHVYAKYKCFCNGMGKPKPYYHWVPFFLTLPFLKIKIRGGKVELDNYCDTYEEAIEVALKYALENLI